MSDGQGPQDEGRRRFVSWLWRLPVLAALGGGSWAGWRYYSVFHRRQPANPDPQFDDAEPVQVASLADLADQWSEVEFSYAGLPVIALHVPTRVQGGIATDDGGSLIAYSRICTHQGCPVELSRDTEAVAFAFNYRSDSPSLVCHCHLSVYDPERAGVSVSGPALHPLPRIRLEARDGQLFATGVERT